jgi:hypothetical protein
MIIILNILIIFLEFLFICCAAFSTSFIVFSVVSWLFDKFNFEKSLDPLDPWDNLPKINKNLLYNTANESSKKNICYVCESVIEWVFECLKNHENKHLKCVDITENFKHDMFNMDRLIVNMGTREYTESRYINGSSVWDWARTNEEIINCLDSDLLKISKSLSKYRQVIGEEPVEVPEKFKNMIRSLFWSL